MDTSGDHELTPEEIADALRLARERDVAPPGLHAQIRAMHHQRSKRPAWRGSGVYGAAFAGAIAVVVALVLLISPGGTPGGPTLAQAAALGTRPFAPNTQPMPARGGLLDVSIGGVHFPDLSGAPYGFRAVGSRWDRIDGRRAVTVYYASNKTDVAYTIVGATQIPWPKGPTSTYEPGEREVHTVWLHGRLVTTWRERGSTCILSGAHVSAQTLEKLASR